MGLRATVSSTLNTALSRLGYALIRVDGSRNPTIFSEHQGTQYAYEAVLIGDGYAPWALDEAFLSVWEAVRESTLCEILAGVFPEESAHRIGDRKVALCHIDVDVYQSASDTIQWLLSRTPRGSVVVFDDYGFSTCKGTTRLVEELRCDGNWFVLHILNKHAILVRR